MNTLIIISERNKEMCIKQESEREKERKREKERERERERERVSERERERAGEAGIYVSRVTVFSQS